MQGYKWCFEVDDDLYRMRSYNLSIEMEPFDGLFRIVVLNVRRLAIEAECIS